VDTVNDTTELESLPVEQLVEMIRERTGAGVNLSFPGKVLGPVLG
jgi:adenine-specific DNA-methyltransferase